MWNLSNHYMGDCISPPCFVPICFCFACENDPIYFLFIVVLLTNKTFVLSYICWQNNIASHIVSLLFCLQAVNFMHGCFKLRCSDLFRLLIHYSFLFFFSKFWHLFNCLKQDYSVQVMGNIFSRCCDTNDGDRLLQDCASNLCICTGIAAKTMIERMFKQLRHSFYLAV